MFDLLIQVELFHFMYIDTRVHGRASTTVVLLVTLVKQADIFPRASTSTYRRTDRLTSSTFAEFRFLFYLLFNGCFICRIQILVLPIFCSTVVSTFQTLRLLSLIFFFVSGKECHKCCTHALTPKLQYCSSPPVFYVRWFETSISRDLYFYPQLS